MITIGVDAHKYVHVALALNDAGREVGDWRGPNSEQGWADLARWAASLADERQWGIEGAWNYGRGLAQHLVALGETVFDINPRWTALRRRSARRPGKTDASMLVPWHCWSARKRRPCRGCFRKTRHRYWTS
jgi:transposase